MPTEINHLACTMAEIWTRRNLQSRKIREPIYLKSVEGVIAMGYADISNAKQGLGFLPMIGLRSGLEDYLCGGQTPQMKILAYPPPIATPLPYKRGCFLKKDGKMTKMGYLDLFAGRIEISAPSNVKNFSLYPKKAFYGTIIL